MKKINYLFSLLFMSLLFAANSNAQTVFSENFNGGNALNNWTLINVDNLVPNAAVNYVTDAWVVREDFDTTGVGDSVAVSTSWYTPAGAADDYMITPMIITTANPVLEYDAKAQDAAFPDGYELRISTTTPDVAGLMMNPPLFSTTGENSAWIRRSINLSAYANDTIYLAWRNNSNDQFLLLIDNIEVFEQPTFDAGISNFISPVGGGCIFSATDTVAVEIENLGINALTSIPLAFSLNGGTVVRDTFVGNLAPGATSLFIFSNTSVDLTMPNVYLFEVYTELAGDGNSANDTINGLVLNSNKTIPYTDDFDNLPSPASGLFISGWSVQSSGAFQWQTNTGPTVSTATGPTGDHTSGNGVYFYTEASSPAAPNEITALTAPCIDLASNPAALNMDFWYHMYGADIQTLYVQVEDGSTWVIADSIVGQQQTANADTFLLKTVDLTPYLASRQFLRVRFITVRGASFDGDIAIDDVSFYVPAPVSVEEVISSTSSLNVFPNPTSLGYTNVEFDLSENSPVQMRLMDLTGKIIQQENYNVLSQGQHRLELNTSNLKSGIYFLNLQIGGEEITRKISVLK